jgi:hypothetical protein
MSLNSSFEELALRNRLISLLIAASSAAVLLVAAAADRGRIDFGECALPERFGFPCPLCGWTRAASAVIRGELGTAFFIQPVGAGSTVLVVLIGVLSLTNVIVGIKLPAIVRSHRQWIAVGCLLLLMMSWGFNQCFAPW